MMKRGGWWPLAVTAILALTVAANFGIYYLANADQGIAIEPDYYKKAVAWDSSMAQARDNATIGWRVTPTLAAFTRQGGAGLKVALTDSAGAAISGATVKVTAFFNGRAGIVTDTTLAAGGGGYEATLPVHHGGVWELRFDVRRGAIHFTSTSRVEAVPAAGP
jgi:hypothetical protein